MRVYLYGKSTSNNRDLVDKLGFTIVNTNPDLIISYGGDGTLLSSEREFPGIPKLPIRNSQFCKKCINHQDEEVLKKLLEGKLQLKEYKKIETEILYKPFFALNDFVIRNTEPIHTIRFKIDLGGPLYIGDGIVVSTPFGSTGYFKTVTQQTFDKGFGLAFNNTTEKLKPLYFNENEETRFKLVRGKATLSFDNSPDILTIDEGSELKFKLSDQTAKIYESTSLRCPNCQVIRG